MAVWRATHNRSAAATAGIIVTGTLVLVALCTLRPDADTAELVVSGSYASRVQRAITAETAVLHISSKGSPYTVFPFVSVLVMVTSAAGWTDRRQLIRHQFPRNLRLINTPEEESVLIKFAIGTQGLDQSSLMLARSESGNFSDMLFFDCPDEDTDLKHPHLWSRDGAVSSTTSKVLLSIQWAVRHFDFQYYFRLGDDSYFRIDKFMTMLTQKEIPTSNAVVGHIMTDRVYGMEQLYPQGMGYGLTHDVCIFIARNADVLLKTAPEDCVVARWLFAVGADFVDSPLWKDIHMGDHCQDDMVLAHKLPAEAWSNIADNGTVQC